MKPKEIPPHLESEEERMKRETLESKVYETKTFSIFGRQGPSKYGKGGSRAHHAKSRTAKGDTTGKKG